MASRCVTPSLCVKSLIFISKCKFPAAGAYQRWDVTVNMFPVTPRELCLITLTLIPVTP